MSRNTRKLLLLFLGVPCLILFFLLAFADWAWGGRVQTSLDPQYVPTAEYLSQNPNPTPNFINLDPPAGSDIEPGDSICITVDSLSLSVSREDVATWTRIYINTKAIPRYEYSVIYIGQTLTPNSPTRPVFCLIPPLEQGFHLIEIRVGASISAMLDPNSALTYTWAYQVE